MNEKPLNLKNTNLKRIVGQSALMITSLSLFGTAGYNAFADQTITSKADTTQVSTSSAATDQQSSAVAEQSSSSASQASAASSAASQTASSANSQAVTLSSSAPASSAVETSSSASLSSYVSSASSNSSVSSSSAASASSTSVSSDSVASKKTVSIQSAVTDSSKSGTDVETDTVTSTKNVNCTTALNGKSRNDGLYLDPALTSQRSMNPVATTKNYNGATVSVSAIDTVVRSNGNTYKYAEITLDNTTYWVDERALFDEVLTQKTASGSYYIDQEKRSDQLYSAPALTSEDSMVALSSATDLNGDTVQILKTITTRRNSNGVTYSYSEISVGGKTYWIDTRALVSAKVTSDVWLSGGQSMIVQKKTDRNDGIYYYDPALVHSDSMTANRTAYALNGATVYLIREVTTQRTNGSTYTYIQVRYNNTYFWIDERALASGFEYSGGVEYYNTTTHVLARNTTVVDRGYSYKIGSNGYLSSSNSTIEKVIAAGLSLVGKSPYDWGGGRTASSIAAKRFDCSSFVYWCFKQAGIILGNQSTVVTTSLVKEGTAVSFSTMQRGDIFFMDGTTHVAIYLGGGYFLHDSPNSPTGGVGISNLSDIVNPYNFDVTWQAIQDNEVRRII